MELDYYSSAVKRTSADLGNTNLNQLHFILGMATEIGELSDVFKKNLAYGKEIDWVNVQEEVGDLLFYVMAFCNLNGFSLEDILKQNVAKLIVRYPEKFNKDKAINRNLEKERKILEELGFEKDTTPPRSFPTDKSL